MVLFGHHVLILVNKKPRYFFCCTYCLSMGTVYWYHIKTMLTDIIDLRFHTVSWLDVFGILVNNTLALWLCTLGKPVSWQSRIIWQNSVPRLATYSGLKAAMMELSNSGLNKRNQTQTVYKKCSVCSLDAVYK